MALTTAVCSPIVKDHQENSLPDWFEQHFASWLVLWSFDQEMCQGKYSADPCVGAGHLYCAEPVLRLPGPMILWPISMLYCMAAVAVCAVRYALDLRYLGSVNILSQH